MRFFLLSLCLVFTFGCEKKKAGEGQKPAVPTTGTSEAPKSTNQPQPQDPQLEDSNKGAEKVQPETKKVYGEPRNLDRQYDQATLEKAYVEIDCARLKNDPVKLEAVFKKYGFDHPKLWTSAWAKASKDKEWVAKLVLAANKACPRPKPSDADTESKTAEPKNDK